MELLCFYSMLACCQKLEEFWSRVCLPFVAVRYWGLRAFYCSLHTYKHISPGDKHTLTHLPSSAHTYIPTHQHTDAPNGWRSYKQQVTIVWSPYFDTGINLDESNSVTQLVYVVEISFHGAKLSLHMYLLYMVCLEKHRWSLSFKFKK